VLAGGVQAHGQDHAAYIAGSKGVTVIDAAISLIAAGLGLVTIASLTAPYRRRS
jgi:hypothetical protein